MDSMIEKLVELINNFDPASYLPDIGSLLGWIELIVRICVMAAPVIMLVFGLSYLLLHGGLPRSWLASFGACWVWA